MDFTSQFMDMYSRTSSGNLRCFPSCDNGVHYDSTFCGSNVGLKLRMPVDDSAAVFGEFVHGLQQGKFEVGESVPRLDSLKDVFLGKRVTKKSASNSFIVESHRRWRLPVKRGDTHVYRFVAYLVVQNQIVAKAVSPTFSVDTKKHSSSSNVLLARKASNQKLKRTASKETVNSCSSSVASFDEETSLEEPARKKMIRMSPSTATEQAPLAESSVPSPDQARASGPSKQQIPRLDSLPRLQQAPPAMRNLASSFPPPPPPHAKQASSLGALGQPPMLWTPPAHLLSLSARQGFPPSTNGMGLHPAIGGTRIPTMVPPAVMKHANTTIPASSTGIFAPLMMQQHPPQPFWVANHLGGQS